MEDFSKPSQDVAWTNTEKALPQARAEFDPFTIMARNATEADKKEQNDLILKWINGPMVPFYCELNPETDMQAAFIDPMTGQTKAALLSDMSPTVNGVRWNITPGKNMIPAELFESMEQTADIARSMAKAALQHRHL